ncbi:MAG: matrixin family metalloprotease [Gemmatimonadota bacterium]|nr:matrixin family metalloprotease [Gemmatimonadota bacterium]
MNRTLSPLSALAIVLMLGGTLASISNRSDEHDGPCGEAGACTTVVTTSASAAPPPFRSATEFCVDVGYLCAELADKEAIQLHRWTSIDGPIVVHVPLPEGMESGTARSLQQAAAQGVRAWNNQPFPVLVDLRGDRSPHFAVRWARTLGGTQLGVTRTLWSQTTGLTVEFIEIGTVHPRQKGRYAEPRQVRLTAAHEMGHALGLPHSDSSRDVMYPTNTATSMSAQDYRSVEALYGVEDGITIRR